MTIPEKAVEWAVSIANDPSHGYDQVSRWGPDYDCSSLVISAYEYAGLKLREAGAGYTGNMRSVFKKTGFKEVPSTPLMVGDVLLNEARHTAMYIGGGRIVQASINELGRVTGGKTGDQTGGEIAVTNYYTPSYGWDCVLRYVGNDTDIAAKSQAVSGLPMLSIGAVSGAALSVQTLLIYKWSISCGSDGADGDYGPNTAEAVKKFQRSHNLDADGIVGPLTWGKLIN